MTTSGQERTRPPEDELVEWIQFVARELPRDNFQVPKASSRDFLILYGMCLQATRFASSYLQLRSSGFEPEAASVARSSFEHAVTAHWVYFVKGGVDRLAIAINDQFRSYHLAMSDYLHDDELRAQVLERNTEAGKGMPPFGQIMWDLDSGAYLRTSYKALSQLVHPTHQTVSSYLEDTPDGTQLRQEPRFAAGYATLYTVAISSMLAYSLMEYIVDPFGARVLVEEPASRLRLPPWLHDAIPDESRRVFNEWS